MTAKLIDGKSLATRIRQQIAEDVKKLTKEGNRAPCLAVILVGDDHASTLYVKNKQDACKEVGITSLHHPLSATISEKELIDLVRKLNADSSVDGILIQLPLPGHINTDNVIDCIDPYKDVDGFHPYNMGRLAVRHPLLRPCTPYGVITLLESIGQTFKNRHAVIIGASNIVGRPMALELLMAGCTITVCHRLTLDLEPYVQQANILISAVGHPGIIKGSWIQQGATVVDIGINRMPDGSIVGDVEFEIAKQRADWITPVPGGVGPMTVATLLKNTLTAYHHRH